MTPDEEITRLKEALRRAILSPTRVRTRCVEYDPSGSTYEVEWLGEVRQWAALCDLDLDAHDPTFFLR
jgi:hypothetical protein